MRKRKKNLPTICALLALLFLSQLTFAQDKESPTPRRKGSITGRVVADDGQPMVNTRVYVSTVGVSDGATRTFTTDEEGNFTADGLSSGTYGISANAPAYISEINRDPDQQKVYRLGETAIITMRKGGVITGRVTNQKGEPLQGVSVNATRVRDEAGRKALSDLTRGDSADDRGVYRIYGLQSGAYVISASGGDPGFRYAEYNETVAVYYPASTRAAATEVKVQAGEEVQGIDLRYHSEKGHRISGIVTGLPLKSKTDGQVYQGANLTLTRVPGSSIEQRRYTYDLQEQKAFIFPGVADGEYEIKASSQDWRNEDSEVYAAPARRVTVKGNDVTGVRLALSPLASVAGQLALELTPEKERPASCPVNQEFWLEETLIALRRADAQSEIKAQEFYRNFQQTALNDKRAFKFRVLEAGRYHLTSRALNEAWYIQSITLKADEPKSKIQNPKSQMPTDVGKQGLSVKPGDKLTGIITTVADGAASLQGRVTAEKPLPQRVRVHLVPAEKEAADDLLRYQEFTSKADGAFAFTNLAPGKYWLLTRAVPDDESDEKVVNPVAWDAAARSKLRTEAEAANQLIELNRCERRRDVALRFALSK